MTKKEAGARGVPCSWDVCKEAAVWKILDKSGQLVRYWCEHHHEELWKSHSHPGMSSVLVGGSESGSKKEIPQTGTGSRGNLNDHPTPAGAASPGNPSGRPTGDPGDRGLSVYPKTSSGSVAPAAGGPGDGASSAQALLPPSTPQLAWWQGAGELQLTEAQQGILWQPVDPAEVLIRPDGIVYLPWGQVWRCLLRTFSPHVPSLIPLSKPAMQDGSMCQHMVLVVAGHYVGDAVGECRYQPTNRQMSWASAAEGAVSDAIVKISKRLGCFQELWSVPWINQWKATHAIRVYRSKTQRWDWRRIDDEPFPDEGRPGRSSPGEGANAQRLEDEVGEHFDSIGREPGQEG